MANHIAIAEIRVIAIVLIIIAALAVLFFMFEAYNSHVKTHVKNVATREVALNNVVLYLNIIS